MLSEDRSSPNTTKQRCAAKIPLAVATCALVCFMVLPPAIAANEGRKPTCQPVAQRTGEVGCWILATQSVDALPADQPVFWHLYTFPDLEAANAARRGHETVTTSLGKVWVMNVAPADWRPIGGERVAVIGPLPILAREGNAVEYMEAISPPGFDSPVHVHPGPEAWYTAAGEVCLETPDGKSVGRAGDARGVVVPGNLPMRLSVTGPELRRSLVMILHDVSKSHTVLTDAWVPRGLCRQG